MVGGNLLPRLPVRIRVGGVPGQQIGQAGRVRDDPDRCRHPHRQRVLIPLLGQALRHPLIEGKHHRHVPGLTAGDQRPQPGLRRRRADLPFRRRDPLTLPIRGFVHLQHRRVHRLQERRPRQLLHPRRGLLIDLGGGCYSQVGGEGRDLTGFPVVHIAGDHSLPQPRQPVTNGQGVGHPRPDRLRRGIERTHQTLRSELRHRWTPRRTQRHQAFDQQPAVGMINSRVRIRPRRRHHQLAAPCHPGVPLDVRSEVGQRTGVAQRRLQLDLEHDHILLEHVFYIQSRSLLQVSADYQAAVRPAPVIRMIASPASSLAARSTSAVIE